MQMGRELSSRDLPWMGEREPEVDIESGGTTSDEDTANDLTLENKQTKKALGSVWSGPLCFDGLVHSSKFGEDANENAELLLNKTEGEEGQQNMGVLNKKLAEEKQKKKNPRKAPKPPRPPKGPSLDASDQKLVQQISELAMKKRARNERIKALKKTSSKIIVLEQQLSCHDHHCYLLSDHHLSRNLLQKQRKSL